IQNSSDGVKQTKKTQGMEDVEDGEDAEEAPSPGQDNGWTDKNDKQEDSSYLNKSHQLFHKTFDNVGPKEEPTPTENKAEQGLNTNQHFFYNVSVNNSTNSSMLEVVRKKRAEEEGSSLGEHSPPVPQAAEKHPKEGSSSLNKPSSSDSLDNASVQGDLIETKLNRHLRLLVPDEALRTFIAHVARALRMDCSLPHLQLACAKMVSKTGLLVKVLSERQDDQGASALLTQCLLEQENVSNAMARAEEEGERPVGKWKPEDTSSDKTLLAIAVSAIIMINVMAVCLMEICSRKRAAASQPQSTSKSRLR
ncbi:L37A2 protein, partial [Pterocles burchelli]|nr:L37A2 protein [Pterocles burchelli]